MRFCIVENLDYKSGGEMAARLVVTDGGTGNAKLSRRRFLAAINRFYDGLDRLHEADYSRCVNQVKGHGA